MSSTYPSASGGMTGGTPLMIPATLVVEHGHYVEGDWLYENLSTLLPSARAVPWVVHWHSDIELSNRGVRLAYPYYRLFERALLERAIEETTRAGGTHLELRHTRQHFPQLTPKRHKVAMELAVRQNVEVQWQAIDRKVLGFLQSNLRGEQSVLTLGPISYALRAEYGAEIYERAVQPARLRRGHPDVRPRHTGRCRRLDRRRVQLQRKAFALGSTLFAARPRAFTQRIGKYWKVWRDAVQA